MNVQCSLVYFPSSQFTCIFMIPFPSSFLPLVWTMQRQVYFVVAGGIPWNKEKKLVRLDSRWYFNRWSILIFICWLKKTKAGVATSEFQNDASKRGEWKRREQKERIVILFRWSLNVPKKISFWKSSFSILKYFHPPLDLSSNFPLPKNTFHVILSPSLSRSFSSIPPLVTRSSF